MHELPITQEIVFLVKEEANHVNATQVENVKVEVGALTGYEPESIKFYYEIFSEDEPILVGSNLEIEICPAQMTCKSCGNQSERMGFTLQCPNCESTQVELVGGKDVLLKGITIKD
jgi:hydrogenase nickel incorporation protein HypA/HybF